MFSKVYLRDGVFNAEDLEKTSQRTIFDASELPDLLDGVAIPEGAGYGEKPHIGRLRKLFVDIIHKPILKWV